MFRNIMMMFYEFVFIFLGLVTSRTVLAGRKEAANTLSLDASHITSSREPGITSVNKTVSLERLLRLNFG